MLPVSTSLLFPHGDNSVARAQGSSGTAGSHGSQLWHCFRARNRSDAASRGDCQHAARVVAGTSRRAGQYAGCYVRHLTTRCDACQWLLDCHANAMSCCAMPWHISAHSYTHTYMSLVDTFLLQSKRTAITVVHSSHGRTPLGCNLVSTL